MRTTIRALAAGFGASLLLLLIELERLRRMGVAAGGSDMATIRLAFLDLVPDHTLLAFFAAAFVLALTSARVLCADRPRVVTLIPGIAPLPVFFWAALELARGAGVVRARMELVVMIGVPLAAALSLWFLTVIVSHARKISVWPAAGLIAVVTVSVGWVNRNYHVGRYLSVHETLQLFELFGTAAIFYMLLRGRKESPPPIKALAGLLIGLGLAVLGLSVWPVGKAPSEQLRAVYGSQGFYSASLLRWRARLDPFEIDDGNLDESLIARIDDWNDLARNYEAELDARLPGRRLNNVLLVSIDTLRPDRLGCYGSNKGLTPNIDAFAADAALCETAYSQYPSTALSTESLFHGRYPRATGIYRKNKGELSPDDLLVQRLSEVARANGMRTGASIAFTREWMESPLFAHSLESFERVNPNRQGAPKLDGEYFADSAMAAMEEFRSERFFLWFHLFDPHHPYEHRPGYAVSEDAVGRYDGEVKYADEQLGRVFAFMKEKGLWDNTVIVFTSDHGEAFGVKGLRYHGSSLQEAQIRVPLIIRVPGFAPCRLPEIVENVDVYQTLVSLLGLEGASDNQGSDLSPLLAEPRVFADRFPSFAYAELPDDVPELSVASTKTAAFREGRWKLIRQISLDYGELYNLEDDPDETRNLAQQETAVRLRLERRLRTMARLTDRFGRRSTSEDIRRQRVEKARKQLRDDDPYKIFDGLSFVQENDLSELRGLVSNIAFDDEQYPELRTRALRLLATWNTDGWRTQAIAWLSADNPVFCWVAGGLLLSDILKAEKGASDLSLVEADEIRAKVGLGDDAEPITTLKAALRLAVARFTRVSPPVVEIERDGARLEALVGDNLVDLQFRRLLLLVVADRLPDPLKYSELFADTQERSDLLEVLWTSGRKDAWLDFARVLLPDRYLPATLKERILELALGHFSDAVVEELAVPLLARWDPSFHEKATEQLAKRLGEARVRVLQYCHGRISDGSDLLASGNHAAAVEALASASARAPGVQATLSPDLDRVRSLIAIDRWAEAKELSRGLVDRARASGSAILLHRAQALESYLSGSGPLDSSARIHVVSVVPVRGSDRWTEPGEKSFLLDIEIANEDRRALLGDKWKHGGRLRVLWSRPGGGEPVYGSEFWMDADLLPGETRKIRVLVDSPDRPGDWKARVIVNEHQGDRFHVHEDERADFSMKVIRPHLGPPEGEWLPYEILHSFAFDASLEGTMPDADGTSLSLVAESYIGAFRSPPLGFSGPVRKLELRGAWRSGIDKADVIQLELIPLPGFPSIPAITSKIAWDGSPFDLEFELPAAVGLYQIEIRIGYRQGVLRLDSIGFR